MIIIWIWFLEPTDGKKEKGKSPQQLKFPWMWRNIVVNFPLLNFLLKSVWCSIRKNYLRNKFSQKQSFADIFWKSYFENFHKVNRKHLLWSPFFQRATNLRPIVGPSCEFYKIFCNTFLTVYLWATNSVS